MISLPGYHITETLEENSLFLYRAIREQDHQNVLIRSALIKNAKGNKKLAHEYELSPIFDDSWTLIPIAWEHTLEIAALVYEDFKGISLDQYMVSNPLDLKRFLQIGISISEPLSKLHQKGIIHKDINPQNILIDPICGEVKIIDFGIASLLPSEYSQPFSNPESIEGALPFLSPEQTGRMNRTIDYRSDMYSLGVTFYQMLTGRLPYQANDAVEWVYNHIVRTPKSPDQINPDIPQPVSNIIMKLMAKLAEERYQSMNGLKYDLTKCLTQLEQSGKIIEFPLGEMDYSGKFQISQKIYGRQQEISSLLNAYQELVNNGKSQLILVSGYSGVGKTVLVNELHKPIVKANGLFISGKFDQFKREIPYSTIIEAFKVMVQIILTLPENKINNYREKIQEALGVNGKIIVDLLPQLEIVIGKQPPVAELPPSESRNRFNMVFEKFIAVFAKREHPLTIFLDDLQWSDPGSLSLIEQIITNPQNEYILIIGAFRDNEVYRTHPLMLTLDSIRKSEIQINEIVLSPLSEEDICSLIKDSLKTSSSRVKLLSQDMKRSQKLILTKHTNTILIGAPKARRCNWKRYILL